MKLEFARFDHKYPGRAIFGLQPSDASRPRMNPLFKALKETVAPEKMTNAEKAKTGEMRLYANMEKILMIQIRGSLGYCQVPNVSVDRTKREVSLEWRDLYTCFYTEKAKTIATVEHASVSNS